MAPSPGDENQPSEPQPRSTGGLAGVFRGLTGAKLTKSPPPQQQHQQPPPPAVPASARATVDPPTALPVSNSTLNLIGLPPGQAEAFEHLKNGQLHDRVAAANQLRYAIASYPLNPVLEIWEAGKDLINASNPPIARIAGWELLTECTKYAPSTDLERREYFQTLTTLTAHPEDFYLQLAALDDLTNHGRNVAGFYYEIFPLLTVWLQRTYHAVKSARKQVSRGSAKSIKGKAVALGEDKNFGQLFAFVKDVIKFNFKFASEKVVGDLMDRLLKICMDTSVEEDLKACISLLDTLVTFGSIPNDKLRKLVHVLSSIHSLVPNLQKDAWHVLGNICKSHHGQSTVRILLDVLRAFPNEAKDMQEQRSNPALALVRDVQASDNENKSKREEKDVIRDVRGSLSVLKKLTAKMGEKGYPIVPLTLLTGRLENVSMQNTSPKISAAILKLLNSMLDGSNGHVNPIIADEQWTPLFSVAADCVENDMRIIAPNDDVLGHKLEKAELDSEDSISYQLKYLINRVENLLRQKKNDFMQRDECIYFLTRVNKALPDSAVELVLSYFKDFRSCLPSDLHWTKNLELVLEGFLHDRSRLPLTRIQALETIIQAHDFLQLVPDTVESETTKTLVQRLLCGLSEETDTLVLQETVSFLVRVSEEADQELFLQILDAFKGVISNERVKSAAIRPPMHMQGIVGQQAYFANQSLTNVATRGYVQIFMRNMNKDATKAIGAFHAIVHVARSSKCEDDARLTAMKMLFRLRADYENRIYLAPVTDSEVLAGTLYRTEASLARKLAEDAAQPSRSMRNDQASASRTSRGISFTQAQVGDRPLPHRASNPPRASISQTQRLWSIPDADALPEIPPEQPSHVLFSHLDKQTTTASNETHSEPVRRVLGMSSWLDALLSLFHQGCHWEVYTFVLVHFPAQLSNHPVFADAVPQIQELRRNICEMIRMNSFQEPPVSSGLRKNDVANCFYHCLTMILSYHRHFQKVDEDDIVRIFTHGITEKTAKTCIHALSVCCHELPLSISKSLVTILQKMSQVITQPFVAMHILEFLAGLGRLHSLYSNFREDEFRIVFGICVRYLQFVRDKKRSQRAIAHASEPPTPGAGPTNHTDLFAQQSSADDLPQYVYALAYHVITFWFLAVKVVDRWNHIAWIAKNLFTDVDGTPTNEEQAQVTIDFMQRVAYSDVNDSIPDPLFNEEHFGEILKRTWVIGHSIVTIKQAKSTGWAEITRRYPSGMSVFQVQSKSIPMPPHEERPDPAAWDAHEQTGSTIYPSHLLLQLIAPAPQGFDPIVRPILLPDEEAVERSIRTFDRISSVDGHKVGVIYIGEGQTQEAEILANSIGSPDYHKFLNGIGTLTRLKGATFNTQGLDREYNSDGMFAFCWRDRVTEIVFHVTTQMPTNLERDARCILKKRHIGNDFVNIIFNDSGLPFKFDTFPSDFNYVNIVITPNPRHSFVSVREQATTNAKANNASGGGIAAAAGAAEQPFFTVQVMSKPGFPEISPAAEPKLVSLKTLPGFVRLLALNASVFSLVWANREGGEHISSWRNRLREINRLRERYGPKVLPAPSPPPSSMGAPVVSGVGGAGAGPGMGQGQGAQGVDGSSSRPPSSMRDSISSIRRSSVATFWTVGSTDAGNSTRSSIMSMPTPTDNTEVTPLNGAEMLVDSVDFSRWASPQRS